MTAVHLQTTGMHCAECPPGIEAELGHVPGVRRALVSRALGLTSVMFDEEVVDVATIRKRISGVGFGTQLLNQRAIL